MTRILTAVFALIAMPAFAHSGHLGEVAGHDHWLAGAAIGAAIAIALWGVIKGKTDSGSSSEDEDEIEAEPKDA